MKYTRALLVFGMIACIPAAWADEATKAAQIDEIFRLTKMDSLQKQIMEQVKRMTPSFMAESGIPADAQQIGRDLAPPLAALCPRRLNWEKLKPAYAKLSTDTFTEEEVSAILMFYRTPAGQALVDKTPMMMNRSMEIVQEQIALLMPQVNQLTRDYLEKYQKERNAPQKQEDTPKK